MVTLNVTITIYYGVCDTYPEQASLCDKLGVRMMPL